MHRSALTSAHACPHFQPQPAAAPVHQGQGTIQQRHERALHERSDLAALARLLTATNLRASLGSKTINEVRVNDTYCHSHVTGTSPHTRNGHFLGICDLHTSKAPPDRSPVFKDLRPGNQARQRLVSGTALAHLSGVFRRFRFLGERVCASRMFFDSFNSPWL